MAGLPSANSVAAGNAVGAALYGYYSSDRFPLGVQRADLLRLMGPATVMFWAGLTVFMAVVQPEALSKGLSSHTARMMLIRVYCSYPVLTILGLGVGIGLAARRRR
jgi:hypothetical protein